MIAIILSNLNQFRAFMFNLDEEFWIINDVFSFQLCEVNGLQYRKVSFFRHFHLNKVLMRSSH